jgi:hypothetical protein
MFQYLSENYPPFESSGVNHLGRYGEISKYSFLSRLISEDEIFVGRR